MSFPNLPPDLSLKTKGIRLDGLTLPPNPSCPPFLLYPVLKTQNDGRIRKQGPTLKFD